MCSSDVQCTPPPSPVQIVDDRYIQLPLYQQSGLLGSRTLADRTRRCPYISSQEQRVPVHQHSELLGCRTLAVAGQLGFLTVKTCGFPYINSVRTIGRVAIHYQPRLVGYRTLARKTRGLPYSYSNNLWISVHLHSGLMGSRTIAVRTIGFTYIISQEKQVSLHQHLRLFIPVHYQ